MGVGKPVVLDTRTFSTQGKAKAFFKDILNQYEPGDRVSDAHAIEISALLRRHTEYANKIASGLAYFIVDLPPDYITKCFQIVTPSGERIPFSYLHCVDKIPR